MNVVFVVNDVHLSGGIGTIVEHARRLRRDHAIDAVLAVGREEVERWEYESLAEVPVLPFHEAAERRFDVAVASWWETTLPLFSLEAKRYAYFVQSMEDRFYPPALGPERLSAALTYALPVAFITEASWIAETLRQLRPEARRFLVRNGVDKDVFRLPEELDVRDRGALRILVEGRPSVWFKGIAETLEAVSLMREERHVTLVTPERAGYPPDAADSVVGPLSHREMAALYAETDVVLKLSRVEGMFGPPLEGFHRGATCVVTPVTGHEEYVEHGWNGLVVDWDDLRGTARALDLLARDRRLLHFLRTNALETARTWPSWAQSSQLMALALRRIETLPPSFGSEAGGRLTRDLRVGMELYRLELQERDELAIALSALGGPQRLIDWARRNRHRRGVRLLLWLGRPLIRRVYGR